MKVDLDKTGMVHLIKGTTPQGDIREDLEKAKLGYTDEDGVWVWDEMELKKQDNQQLYNLYKTMRY